MNNRVLCQFSLALINVDGSKTGQGRRGYLEEGAWDAIHVIEVHFPFPFLSLLAISLMDLFQFPL